jgi:hypothetical protein
MSDLPQSEENQSKLEPPPPADVPTHSPDTSPKKPRRKLLIIIIGGLLVCLCAWYADLFSTGVVQQDNWLAVTDAFMRAMANQDPNKAYALFSAEFQSEIPDSELEGFLSGPSFALFDGYLEMEMSAWEISSTREGKVAEINATVTYEGGYSGSFDAVLVQERDEWKLISFNVTVPPDKSEDWEKNNP